MAEALQPLKMSRGGEVPRSSGLVRVFPPLTLILFLAPVGAGLVGALLPSFGYFPAIGGERLTLAPWRDLFAAPGLAPALRLTFVTGFGATFLALSVAVALIAAWQGTRVFARFRRWLAALLALPHAAFAIGLAFLLAPSGWIARVFSPWATGWHQPPDIAFIQDSNGLALTLALASKELFFLILMILMALGQVRADRLLVTARTMGYGPVCAWIKAVLPQVYRQIRLPVYAVLAYSMSVADMALVLGPTNPPTFGLLVLRWFQDPALPMRYQAAAGGMLLFLCVVGAILMWRLSERLVASAVAPWLIAGRRDFAEGRIRWISMMITGSIVVVMAAAVLALVMWSVTEVWPFPAALPFDLSAAAWQSSLPNLAGVLIRTMAIAGVATAIALTLALGCLENERRNGISPTQRALALLYTPLIIPQISFLLGFQIILVVIDLDGSWAAVILSHLVFVIPYVFLVLADSFRALDPRYAKTAAGLGASPHRIFWRIQLPLLLPAVLAAGAVGLAVSIGQYLTTLLPGAGRLSTVTTEAVALASGGDRRITSVYALVQVLVPLAAFAVAAMIPLWRGRRRQGLRLA